MPRPSGLCPTSHARIATFGHGRGARSTLTRGASACSSRGRTGGSSSIGDGRAERSGRRARTASERHAQVGGPRREREIVDATSEITSNSAEAVRPGPQCQRCDRAIQRPDRSSAPCAHAPYAARDLASQCDRSRTGPSSASSARVRSRRFAPARTPPATCNSSPAGNASISSSWTGCGSGSPRIVNRFPATTTNGRPSPASRTATGGPSR